jgi:hypothetical protein
MTGPPTARPLHDICSSLAGNLQLLLQYARRAVSVQRQR